MEPEPITQSERSQSRRDWGALIFACVLAAAVLFFAWSVLGMARRPTDWLLIVPAAVLGAATFLWAGLSDIRVRLTVCNLTGAARGEAARPLVLIGLTGAFACAAPFIGFDLGAAIFILLCLLVQGERSWWKLALASVGGTALMTWIFVDLLMVRLPVLFL